MFRPKLGPTAKKSRPSPCLIAALRAQLAAQPPAARAAAARRKGAVKETQALPNGTEVLRFDAGREQPWEAESLSAHLHRHLLNHSYDHTSIYIFEHFPIDRGW